MAFNFNGEYVKVRRIPSLEEIEIQTMNFTRERRSPRHVHHEYVFSLILKGASEFDCRHCGQIHLLRAGDLVITEAEGIYASQCLGNPPWMMLSLKIPSKKLLSFLQTGNDDSRLRLPHFIQGAVRNAELGTHFQQLYKSLAGDKSALEQETLLLDWLNKTIENYSLERNANDFKNYQTEHRAIKKARDYIIDKFADNINLQELAEVTALSPFHLNRLFKKQIGIPPHEFQNQIRIEKACKLIAQRKAFSDIALETGFADQSHFTRFFKRYIGVTPKKFFVE